jgi:hypothetical protein
MKQIRIASITIVLALAFCGLPKASTSSDKGSPDATGPVELRGLLLRDCIGIPECCLREFCLHLCDPPDLQFVESDSLDLALFYGQEVRLTGSFYQCGDSGCWNMFNVTGAVINPCLATPVEPSTWGAIKNQYR